MASRSQCVTRSARGGAARQLGGGGGSAYSRRRRLKSASKHGIGVSAAALAAA